MTITIPFTRGLSLRAALKPEITEANTQTLAKIAALYVQVKGGRVYVAAHVLWFVVGVGWL